jgi:hypothetical protein
MKTVDVRFTIEDDTDVPELLQAIADNLEVIESLQVLENDGFSRMLPRGFKTWSPEVEDA